MRPAASGLPAWAIGPLFLALAWWMVSLSPPIVIPRSDPITVSRDRIVPGALRKPMGDPPTAVIGGYTHACNECHQLFSSPPLERRTLMQHTHITLNHGMNDRCFNCHDRANRERLVLHDGTPLRFDEVPRLCSQCHGTVFRDWQRGTHGKTLGSWDTTRGDQHRLICNDCHNPHSPAYPKIEPLPGPRTLRMGDQSEHHQPSPRHTPLRQWSEPSTKPGPHGDTKEERP